MYPFAFFECIKEALTMLNFYEMSLQTTTKNKINCMRQKRYESAIINNQMKIVSNKLLSHFFSRSLLRLLFGLYIYIYAANITVFLCSNIFCMQYNAQRMNFMANRIGWYYCVRAGSFFFNILCVIILMRFNFSSERAKIEGIKRRKKCRWVS